MAEAGGAAARACRGRDPRPLRGGRAGCALLPRHRLAIANGIAPRAFASVLGLGGGMWSPRLDLRPPRDVAAWLGVRTGVASEAISAMAMTDGTLAPLLLPLRETARRNRSTWIQYCALCFAEDRAPYFRRSWRLASRISCFRHGCGLRDRCPACRGGIAPFAHTDLIPQHVCVRCGFDLRGAAKVSVEAAARRSAPPWPKAKR